MDFKFLTDFVNHNKETIALLTGVWLGIQTIGKGIHDAVKAVPPEVTGFQRYLQIAAKFFSYISIGKRAE